MCNAYNSWISLCDLTLTAPSRGKNKRLFRKSYLTVYMCAEDVIIRLS